jgi:hypothetical protein
MLKKQQRWIALVVVCTFMWLLQVSSMPLAAAGASAQIGSATAEQGPDYVEAISHKAAPAKKKSILPLVLIGVGALAVTAAVLFLVVLKNYDITGNWSISWRWTAGSTASDTVAFTFVGTKKSGAVSEGYGDTGTYSVDGKNVTWTLSSYDPQFVWTGKFDGKDKMSGTMALPSQGDSGTWTATRVVTTASVTEPAQTAKKTWSKN